MEVEVVELEVEVVELEAESEVEMEVEVEVVGEAEPEVEIMGASSVSGWYLSTFSSAAPCFRTAAAGEAPKVDGDGAGHRPRRCESSPSGRGGRSCRAASASLKSSPSGSPTSARSSGEGAKASLAEAFDEVRRGIPFRSQLFLTLELPLLLQSCRLTGPRSSDPPVDPSCSPFDEGAGT